MTEGSDMPCVLVVDDDAITLRFFEAAFRQMHMTCVAIESGAAAKVAVENQRFDLLMIDRHLPDTSGPALLKAMRDASVATPAIATSADVDAQVRADMIEAGFVDIIAKPIGTEKLRDLVAVYVAMPIDETPVLDDEAALQSLGGSVDALGALRVLLADELDDLVQAHTKTTAMDNDEFIARLHRLRASCGFCGALALAEIAMHLQHALRDRTRDHRREVSRFLKSCAATATRLRETPTAHR
ncbi:MAG: response regulator [Rudaea sp.]